jgi:methylated-DNA-[protein]-cysteine S-methyltransferase
MSIITRAMFTHSPTQTTEKSQLTAIIAQELSSYFSNPHHRFQLTLKPHGTVYQQRVWNAMLVIPVGRTVTYDELAKSLLSSPRAIGQTCKANFLALFIPSHCVVGKNNLGGFMGRADALCFKTSLLEHEG